MTGRMRAYPLLRGFWSDFFGFEGEPFMLVRVRSCRSSFILCLYFEDCLMRLISCRYWCKEFAVYSTAIYQTVKTRDIWTVFCLTVRCRPSGAKQVTYMHHLSLFMLERVGQAHV